MKITVIGANGKTGRHIIKIAKLRGHDVKAAVRRPETLDDVDGIAVAKISLDDEETLTHAFAGADAVISAIGHGGLRASAKPTTMYSGSTKVILSALENTGVNRLIVLSSGGVVQDDNAPWFYKNLLRPYLINTYLDMARMETILEQEAHLDWTAVRLTYLLDGQSKPIIANEGKIERGNFKIHFEDAAKFIINCLEQKLWVQGHPVIGYEK